MYCEILVKYTLRCIFSYALVLKLLTLAQQQYMKICFAELKLIG